MITVISRFPLPEGITDEELTEAFARSVPVYSAHEGLLRKYYYRTGDRQGGGVYLFEDRASAEALFDDAFRARLAEKYGDPVTVEFLPTLVVLDTAQNDVWTAAGSQ